MNAVTEYRPQALTVEAFDKLDDLATRSLSFRDRVFAKIVRKQDEYGDAVEVREYEVGGEEIFPKGEVDARLIESLNRPTTFRYTIQHLTRLSAHLPYGRGAASFGAVVEDLARDLEGVSEFAIVRVCEKFRADESFKFFPPTATIIRRVRDLDFSLKNLKTKKAKAADFTPPAPEPKPRTTKDKIRVARLCRLAVKPRARWTAWEIKFFNAVTKKGTSP